MLTLERFRELEAAVVAAGHSASIGWSEQIAAPKTPKAFAKKAIYVICNSGMRVSMARGIYDKCMAALRAGHSAKSVFGHAGKAAAIDHVWAHRKELFAGYMAAADKLTFCEGIAFVGPITSRHLAKNLGVDVAKADVHLQRLADVEGCSVQQLCDRLALLTGYRAATIDTILWRACADGILNSRIYRDSGWEAAFISNP